jgi:Tol biopolymer transport system component
MTRVSTDSNGLQGDNTSYRTPMFSPDGTKIAFTSAANLAVGDNNSYADIFVKDLNTGLVTLVSTTMMVYKGIVVAMIPYFRLMAQR